MEWCLLLEASGICSGAWVLAELRKQIAGFQEHEEHIGTGEELAASHKEAYLVNNTATEMV